MEVTNLHLAEIRIPFCNEPFAICSSSRWDILFLFGAPKSAVEIWSQFDSQFKRIKKYPSQPKVRPIKIYLAAHAEHNVITAKPIKMSLANLCMVTMQLPIPH